MHGSRRLKVNDDLPIGTWMKNMIRIQVVAAWHVKAHLNKARTR
jgi:hypothetical protein